MRAVAHERASLSRCEGEFDRGIFADIRLQIQFIEFQPMSDICALEEKHDRLTLFERDLAGNVSEAFGGHFNAARRLRRMGAQGPLC